MNDLDVYNACMSFCKLFGNVIAHQSQLTQARLVDDEINIEELEHRVRIEKGWLNDEFDHLYDVITKFKEDGVKQ